VTFEQALAFALDIAQRRQRPAYVIELANGWAVSSDRPRHARSIPVEPPSPDLLEEEEEE